MDMSGQPLFLATYRRYPLERRIDRLQIRSGLYGEEKKLSKLPDYLACGPVAMQTQLPGFFLLISSERYNEQISIYLITSGKLENLHLHSYQTGRSETVLKGNKNVFLKKTNYQLWFAFSWEIKGRCV
jgi:hypothetical protein